MKTTRSLTLLIFFLSLCTHALGQTWQPDSETLSNGVRIQNSFPKGVARHRDFLGNNFVYVTFWTRIMNETATPLELTIDFPADSFAIPSMPQSYSKLFLLPYTMTVDKQELYNYGLTDLTFFLNDVFYKSTSLQRTIPPNKEYAFYCIMLSYMPEERLVRAGFILKGHELFYRINSLDPEVIPCGKILFLE